MNRSVTSLEKNRRLRSAMILASFVVLFGGGLVVYGVAWGARAEAQHISHE